MSDHGTRGAKVEPVEPAFPVEAAIDALGRATLKQRSERDIARR